jgi:hypothetical protein
MCLLRLNLGQVAQRQGRHMEAAELFKAGMAQALELGHTYAVAGSMDGLAAVAASSQQAERAARLYGAANALMEVVGVPMEAPDQVDYDHNQAAARAQLDEATWKAAWEEGRAMSMEQAVAYALEDA